jgi:F420-dependent oxidoreductase-like protein
VTDAAAAQIVPSPCVVVLVGPGASGKTTWADAHFGPDLIVSSDRLRAVVGTGEDDISASDDAFVLLDLIVQRRMARRLTTVIDTLGLDQVRRQAWLLAARQAQIPCIAVLFDVPPGECRTRNRMRTRPIPAAALTAQLKAFGPVKAAIDAEGFDLVIDAAPVRAVAPAFSDTAGPAERQAESPIGLRFGLHIGSYTFPGGPATTASTLRRLASAAEEAGFHAIYVMDHFRQIPQIGRPWEDFLESYTTLAYLAASTERARLGVMVSAPTYRNPAHLGKIVATLDVLSGGRAVCGLGLGWHAEEHAAYGWEFPPVGERYELLEDALRMLPVMWGKGSAPFKGARISVPETMCYPRPLQDKVPIIVGGGGERRTLRLAAQYADGANVMGDLATVSRKAKVLRDHCAGAGRDPEDVALSHLSTVLVAGDDRELDAMVDRLRPRRTDPAKFARSVHGGTVADHIGRFRQLAEAGVKEVMVRLADPLDDVGMERISAVISAFR